MKKLHHPGTPCKINSYQDLDISQLGTEYQEVVNCSEGQAIFVGQEFWVSDEEFSSLNLPNNPRVFNVDPFDLNGWGFYVPMNLEIELTKDCNQRCIHCWNESGEGPFIPSRKLEEIVTDFRSRGGQKLRLTGGEPFLHPSFFAFIKYSREKGIRNIEITTNGSLINEGNVEDLGRYLSRINISLHGATEETHNGVTRRSNYQKTRDAIDLCRNQGIDTVINFTVMEENKGEIEKMFKLFQGSGNRMRFNMLMQKGSGRRLRDISSEVVRLRKAIDYFAGLYPTPLERSGLYPRGYNEGIESAKFYGCSALRTSIYISSEGLVFPCNLASNPLGSIYKDSVFDIWRSENAQKVRGMTLCEKSQCNISCGGKCKAKEI